MIVSLHLRNYKDRNCGLYHILLNITLVVIIGAFSFCSISAQEHPMLQGRVVNVNNDPLQGAVVACLQLPDSVVVSYSITGTDGGFKIIGYKGDLRNSVLEVSFLGYDKLYAKPSDGEMVVTLKESALVLDKGVVTAHIATLRHKPGRFIFKPHTAEVEGMDCYGLLRFTPLLSLESDVVNILGKGVSSIYINGRKPVMDNASIMDMLRSTPAGQIERIEIITTPNSSYAASLTGGVVNIIMKNNPDQGLIGNIGIGGSYNENRLSPRASLYLGYAKDKLKASANLVYNDVRSFNRIKADYSYNDSFTDICNMSTVTGQSVLIGGNASLNYDFTPNSKAGISMHISGTEGQTKSDVQSTYYLNKDVEGRSLSKDVTENPYDRPEIGVVAYYNLKTDRKGSNIDMSASYSGTYQSCVREMEYFNGKEQNQLITTSLFQQNSLVSSTGYEIKCKYSHFFADDSNLETGYELNASRMSNNFERKDYVGGEYVKNMDFDSDFLYKECINSAFVTYERAFGETLSAVFGLRLESTSVKGLQRHTQEVFRHNYLNLFPQLSLNWDLAEGDHCLALDLSRSIVRPFYNDLNPFKIWTSENTYTAGNPQIKPMLYSDVDLSYVFKGDYVCGIAYSHGTDAFGEYTFSADGNTTISSIANFGSEDDLSLYMNMNKALFSGIWRVIVNAGADYEIVKGTINAQDVSYRSWMGTMGIRNMFRLSKRRNITGNLSYSYHTPSYGILKVGRHKHLLSVSLNKQFKFGGVLSIDAMNLLGYVPAYHYSTEHYSYSFSPQTYNVSIQLRYVQKFGKEQVKAAKDRSMTNLLGRFRK